MTSSIKNNRGHILARPLIIGIDPGTTTAVSLLDLEGNIVSLQSRKHFPRQEIVRYIAGYGQPVIIASDIFPAPRIIEKIAAGFVTRTLAPRKRLSRREKTGLTKLYATRNKIRRPLWRNRHEKDALVAALYAWNTVRPLISRIAKKAPAGLSQPVKVSVLADGRNIGESIRLARQQLINR